MVKIFRTVLFLSFFMTVGLNAQNISVSASTDTSIYKVGDYIKYTLDIKHGKSIKVYLPSVKDSIKTLEFIQAGQPEKNEVNNNVLEKYTFIFSKYDSAQVTIPSYKIAYTVGSDAEKKFIAVNPLTIVVKTLQVNQQEEIRDIKEPMTLPLNWLLISLIVLGIFILCVAGYFAYRYYEKKKLAKAGIVPIAIIPPHEIALNELKELESKKLWQQGNVKDYHSQITEIIRKYFEARFDFHALEITSPEIIECLNILEEGKDFAGIANDFFSNADMVKFAKFQPMPAVNDEMMKQAYRIVNETIPKPKPVEIAEPQKEVENAK
jgi:hypothetical protein